MKKPKSNKASTPKIKVCGMRDPENIIDLVKLNPDFIGFILYPPSKRYLGDNYKLSVTIPKRIKRVGVFVNALLSDIVQWTNKLNLDYAQLHGNESADYCRELKGMGIGVIKAFGIDPNFDFSILSEFEPCVNFFLFDTKSKDHGGSGQQFTWSVLSGYNLSVPFFLSGGIGPDDVARLDHIDSDKLFAYDINSKFEQSPAQKNIGLLDKFINDIRNK